MNEPDPRDFETRAWEHMRQAVGSATEAFHTLALATVDAAGRPQCRTVVVREVDETRRRICFHLDRRSPKYTELAQTTRAALLLYDVAARMQVRISAKIVLHTDSTLADTRWAASTHSGQLCYTTEHAPSVEVSTPPTRPARPHEIDAAPGRRNFVVAECWVEALEVLILTHTGHQRALIQYSGAESVQRKWLAP